MSLHPDVLRGYWTLLQGNYRILNESQMVTITMTQKVVVFQNMVAKASNTITAHTTLIFLGDIAIFMASLWGALALRSLFNPSRPGFLTHLGPFIIVFTIWLFTFYMAGLYGPHTVLFRKQLPSLLGKSALVGSAAAILLFYLVPYFGITPKTLLFFDLVITFSVLFLWRFYVVTSIHKGARENALIVGGRGYESGIVTELEEALRNNPQYGLRIVNEGTAVSLDRSTLEQTINDNDVSVVIVNVNDEDVESISGDLYRVLFSGVRIVDMQSIYEDIFARVPMALVSDRWFLENISLHPKPLYTFAKRAMDIVISIPLFIVIMLFYPFIYIAQQLESRGPFFYIAKRVGENNKHVPVIKIRTMTGTDFDKPGLSTEHRVTKTGNFLRRTRIDETPQLWNVIRGDLSLIGPRPEFPALVAHYESAVPFYTVRHVVKPGLSGWGQVNDKDVPREDADVVLTARKLSYDLFYIKNRSFWLDIKIALKTIRTVLSRAGS